MAISFEALKDTGSGRLFCGQLISQACDKMMTLGMVWILAQRSSAAIIPWFLAVAALPHLLLSWHSGRWTVAFGPLRTIIGADLVRGALFVALAAGWSQLPERGELLAFFVTVFLSGIAGALFNPAILSLPVFLTDGERLLSLTAWIDSCFSLGNILGPLLAALLFPWTGVRGLFLFNGLSYFLAAGLEAGIRLRPGAPNDERPLASSDSRPDPIRELFRRDSLMPLMLGGFLAINLFLAPLTVFLPLFAKLSYHGSIQTLAWLETSIGVGTVLGGLWLSFFPGRAGMGIKITAGMIAVALAYLGFSLTRDVRVGCALLFILGFALATVNVLSLTLFQSRPEPAQVPSVMSLVNLISVASLPVSMFGVGLLVSSFDVRALALTFGALLSLVTLGVVLRPEIRTA